MERTFLLGVGAQKAGTTWLYSYLKRHPECRFYIKEYAVWATHYRRDLDSPRATRLLLMLAEMAKEQAGESHMTSAV